MPTPVLHGYLFLITFPDLCGIIANTTFADSPRDSCKILMESGIVASCIPDVETNLSGAL